MSPELLMYKYGTWIHTGVPLQLACFLGQEGPSYRKELRVLLRSQINQRPERPVQLGVTKHLVLKSGGRREKIIKYTAEEYNTYLQVKSVCLKYSENNRELYSWNKPYIRSLKRTDTSPELRCEPNTGLRHFKFEGQDQRHICINTYTHVIHFMGRHWLLSKTERKSNVLWLIISMVAFLICIFKFFWNQVNH